MRRSMVLAAFVVLVWAGLAGAALKSVGDEAASARTGRARRAGFRLVQDDAARGLQRFNLESGERGATTAVVLTTSAGAGTAAPPRPRGSRARDR